MMGLRSMRKIDEQANVNLFEETLSDGSKAYTVAIGSVEIDAIDAKDAFEIFTFLAKKQPTIY